jgi:hypothetical protein
MIPDHLLAPLAIHRGILWQEVNAASSHSRKAAPNNDGIWVLHSNGCEAGVKVVGSDGCPHLGFLGPNAPEC